MEDRDEHLAWCKRRALEYLNRNDVENAITSMLSDLSKHEDFVGISKNLSLMGMWIIVNQDFREARRFIEGFR